MSMKDAKKVVLDFYEALEGANAENVGSVLAKFVSSDYKWHGLHPFNEQSGPEAVAKTFYEPFFRSFQAHQRRQDVFIGSINEIDGEEWVLSMGQHMGLFNEDFVGIPANRRIAFLRYADFNCVKNGKIVKSGFFFDLIDLMKQAGLQPLPMQTGDSFLYPGPATHDGLRFGETASAEGKKTKDLVNAMVDDLSSANREEAEVGHFTYTPQRHAKFWSEKMIWYGPSGIGTSYTIPIYMARHQMPFRENLGNKVFNGHLCRVYDGAFGGFFGWPNLSNTPSGGFLGLPGSNIRGDMRVVDVYRREGDKLVENWCLMDIPYWLLMQGVDILGRCREIREGAPFKG